MSDNDIADLFSKCFELKIDRSSILGFRDQLPRAGFPLYRELLGKFKKSPYINAYETGRKLDGKTTSVEVCRKKVSITHIDRSRGNKVVEEVLMKKCEGVVST